MKLTPEQQRLMKEFGKTNSPHCLEVDIPSQTLTHSIEGKNQHTYPISTSKYGSGEQQNTFKTPRGIHIIYLILGRHGPEGQQFKNREPAGIITEFEKATDKDFILCRVLCLDGLEEGFNRGGSVDSKSRYIYIHGTNHENQIGKPVSDGCIRMRNVDIIALVDAHDLQGAICVIQG